MVVVVTTFSASIFFIFLLAQHEAKIELIIINPKKHPNIIKIISPADNLGESSQKNSSPL